MSKERVSRVVAALDEARALVDELAAECDEGDGQDVLEDVASLEDLARELGLAGKTLHVLKHRHEGFPEPVLKLGNRAHGYSRRAVREWVESRQERSAK